LAGVQLHCATAALVLQGQVWAPIPIAPGVKCLPKGFDRDGLFDRLDRGERHSEEEIYLWWTRWPDAQVGLVTGAATGLIVLDVDGAVFEICSRCGHRELRGVVSL